MKHRNITRSADRTAQSSEFNVAAPRLRPSVYAVRHALRGIAAVAALQLATPAAFALPTGEVLISGNATVARSTNQMDITQTTAKASLNWTSFSIAAPETVNVNQTLGSSSVLLNRVVGTDQSQIFGALNANGKVFLVNPNGILFAPGASVSVGGLVASTLDITDANFAAGGVLGTPYVFDRVVGSAAGSVVNQTNIAITVPNSYVAMIGTNVSNEGTISVVSTNVAARGSVALAAGDRVMLNIVGDNLINVSVDASALGASILNKNGAQILADGGNVFLTARSADALLGTVINMDGLIRANTLTTGENGTIVLDAGDKRISVTGTMVAHGTDPGTVGGSIAVKGREIELASSATVDVDGVLVDGTIAMTIGEGGGAGNLTIGSGTTLLGDSISVTGNAGTDTITVTRDADMTLTNATLTVGTAYTLALTSIDAANLTGGANANAITASAFSGAVTVNASGGADTVTGNGAGTTFVGANADSTWDVSGANAATYTSGSDTTALTGVGHLVGGTAADSFTLAAGVTTFNGSIAGGGGTDTLAATDGTNAWSITGGNSGTLNTTTTFSGISNLVGGSADDTLTGVAAGSSWSITGANAVTVSGMNATNMEHLVGGTGADTFTLASTVTTFNGSIAGGGGIDTLAATDGANAWTVDGSNSGTLNTTTTFTSISNLTGGSGADTFTFGAAGIISGLIDGGLGADAADYSASTAVTTVTLGTSVVNVETLTGATGQTLVGANIANTWSITGVRTGDVNDGDGAGTVAFSGFDALKGGTSTDSFTLASGVATVNGSIAGGGGIDTLAATDGANAWTVDGSNSGTLNTTTTFTGISNLTGGSGADTFTYGAAGIISGLIDGGAGIDSADYSASAAVTTVTLGTGVVNVETLTGAAGQTLVGANITNTWSITGDRTGEVNDGDGTGTVAFSGFDALKGGTSTDSFTLASTVTTFNGSIAGGGGIDTLAATDGMNTWSIAGSNSGTLNTTTAFSGISNLTGGSDGDTFTFGAGGIISGLINGGLGADAADYSASTAVTTVTLGTSVVNVETLTGAAGQTLVGANIANTWSITGDRTGEVNDGDGAGTVAFSGFDALKGGTSTDSFTLASTVTTFNGSIAGGGGIDTLAATDGTNTWTIDGSNSGTLNTTTAFSGISNLTGGSGTDNFTLSALGNISGTIDGGTGTNKLTGNNLDSTWSINATNAGSVTNANGSNAFTNIQNLTGGTAADSFTLTATGHVTGTIDGGTGTNTLTGNNVASTWTINASNAGTLVDANGTNTFTNIQNLTGGTNTDSFTLTATGHVTGTIDGGTGTNTLTGNNVSSTWTINALNAGSLTDANGTNAFTHIQNLTGGTATDSFTLTAAGNVTGTIDGGGGLGVNTLTGNNLDSTWSIDALNTGSVTDVNGLNAFTNIQKLTGGTQADSFTLSGAGSVTGTIDGGGGTNSLQARDVVNTWNITGLDAGNVTNVNAFTNIQNLVGGTGADTFVFTDAASVSTINGRGGLDKLDFSAYTTPVDVTLTALGGIDGFNGTTTGPVNPISGSFSNIDAAVAPLAPVTSKLTGANVDASWSISGLNSGTYTSGANSLAFTGYENLTGGGLADSFTLSAAGSVSGTIDGGGGLNTLQARDLPNTWHINGINSGSVDNVGLFANIQNLVGGTSSDTFIFANAAAVSTINGRGGLDTLDFSAYTTPIDVALTALGAIDGFNGTTAAAPTFSNIDAASAPAAQSNRLTGANVSANWTINGLNAGTYASGPNTLAFSGFRNLTGGALADSFRLSGAGNVTGLIDGGGGTNTLTGNDLLNAWAINAPNAGTLTDVNGNAFVNIQNMTGGSLTDSFVLSGTGSVSGTIDGGGGVNSLQARDDVANTWTINGGNQGDVTNVHAFTHIHNLVGGSSTDTFNFCDCASVTSIDGRGGVDTLNLALYTTKVDVTLTGVGADGFSGTTAGTPNPITGTFSNIDSVTGPAGLSNTLTGANLAATWSLNGAGSGTYTSGNSLSYSGFRNLTGGAGADTFTGNGGSIAGALTDLGGTTTLNSVLNVGSLNLGATLLGSNTTVSAGGDVTFTSTVNGAFDLAVNTSGATKFMGDVGGVAALKSLTTDAPGTTTLGGNITTTGVQTYNDAVSAGTVTLRSTGNGTILATNTANDFTGTLTVIGGTVKVIDANALTIQLTSGETYVIANASGSTGDLAMGGMTGNLTAVSNGGVVAWNNLTTANAIVIAATPLINGTPNAAGITGPSSTGNVLAPNVTYTKHGDATGSNLTANGELVLIAKNLPRTGSGDFPSITARNAIMDITSLQPGDRVKIVLNGTPGSLRLLANTGTFAFAAGSSAPGGVSTLNPDQVKVTFGGVSLTSTRDELASRAAVTAAQQSALNSASSDARQSFGTDSVTQQIDMGFAGDVGIAPTMAHNVPLQGEIISTPEGVTESKGGQ